MGIEEAMGPARALGTADLVVLGGRIRTMDRLGTIVSALAVKDGRIIALGSDAEIHSLAGTKTRRLNVRGSTVLPGFIETHAHVQHEAIARENFIQWPGDGPATLDGLLARVREHADRAAHGTWIRTSGFAPALVTSGDARMPTRRELDAISPSKPVAIVGIPTTPTAANSVALALAGIGETVIEELDRSGTQHVGGLVGHQKGRLDPMHPFTALPRYGPVERQAAVRRLVQAELSPVGITSVHDMITEPEEVATWIRLRRAQALDVRVQLMIRGLVSRTPLDAFLALGLEHGLGDEWLRFGGIKLSVDGIDTYRGAAVYDPYPGEPENTGSLQIEPEKLNAAVEACHRAGVRLIVHAIGPRAVDLALDAFEQAGACGRENPLRHRLEHVHMPSPRGQVERLANSGLHVGLQPIFLRMEGDHWIDIWGIERLLGTMPLRSMLSAGIRIFGGSDCFAMPPSPLLSMRVAIDRQTSTGKIIDPSQAISIDEAVQMWTTWAAWAAGEEDIKGSLEVGKLGDFVVLSEDPYRAQPPSALAEINVLQTAVGGNVVYDRAGSAHV